jgi:hypothetical protein
MTQSSALKKPKTHVLHSFAAFGPFRWPMRVSRRILQIDDSISALFRSELAEVLWHMLLAPSFQHSGPLAPVYIFFAFFFFFLLTIIILVVMEGLSAFLHVLRLHW